MNMKHSELENVNVALCDAKRWRSRQSHPLPYTSIRYRLRPHSICLCLHSRRWITSRVFTLLFMPSLHFTAYIHIATQVREREGEVLHFYYHFVHKFIMISLDMRLCGINLSDHKSGWQAAVARETNESWTDRNKTWDAECAAHYPSTRSTNSIWFNAANAICETIPHTRTHQQGYTYYHRSSSIDYELNWNNLGVNP